MNTTEAFIYLCACAATGAHAEMLQSCNNVTRMDYDAGMHYQQLMTENLDAIEEALK